MSSMEFIDLENWAYEGEMSSFHMEDFVGTFSLLDDDHYGALKKFQGHEHITIDAGQEVDHDLFPELLPLAHDPDPLASDWMENVDLSHFTDKSTPILIEELSVPVQCSLPITIKPEDVNLLQSLLEDSESTQLTPPVSPAPQVAPEIDLDNLDYHQAAWEVINSPLSPRDIESLLSPTSTAELLSPVSSPQSPPYPNSCPSPDSSQLSTIDYGPISEQKVTKKSRPKPYERSRRKAAVRTAIAEDPDFTFRADEKLSKRERKKLQNKNAATKYRQKKKEESSMVTTEEKMLEQRNQELQDKVDQLSTEISCMKEVLGDIYKGLKAKARK